MERGDREKVRSQNKKVTEHMRKNEKALSTPIKAFVTMETE
jgi:hypothetical protein